jgi:hypothetical protein
MRVTGAAGVRRQLRELPLIGVRERRAVNEITAAFPGIGDVSAAS